jgi:hypothetical protein
LILQFYSIDSVHIPVLIGIDIPDNIQLRFSFSNVQFHFE